MKSSVLTWTIRALWLSLPVTLGAVFAESLQGASLLGRTVWQVCLWALWAGVLGASFVQLPWALTVIRILMPLTPILGVVFGFRTDRAFGLLGAIGLACAVAATVIVMSGDVGAEFIDGPSYGDERRLGLRPPGFLVIGLLPLLWVITVAPALVGVALLGAGRWVAGVVCLIIGVAAAWYGFRLLNRLANRCIVLVPAGLTLVDPLALAEPTLFRRDDIRRLGPAPVDSSAFDLTVGAPGLILSAEFDKPLGILPAPKRGEAAETIDVTGVLLAPTRPGLLLSLAQERRTNVERR